MASKRDSTSRRFLIFLVLSLALHLTFVLLMYHTPLFYTLWPATPPPPTPDDAQEVVFVNPQDILPSKPKQALELADIAKPKVEKAPKKARFAARYNSSVEEETVAKSIPKRAKADVEVSEEPEAPRKPPQQKKTPPPTPQKVPSQVAKPSKAPEVDPKGKEGTPAQEKVSLSDLELKPSDVLDIPGDNGKGKKPKAEPSDDGAIDLAALPKSSDFGGPGDQFVHDFMPSVKIGDKTYLNAFAFPDVQYFTRLKRVFRMRFNPREPLVSHFRYNRVVVGKVNVTMGMEVTSSGELAKVFVIQSSGIPGYDREALRTIRQSAPFTAPPEKIRGKDGMLRMTWHFTTYL